MTNFIRDNTALWNDKVEVNPVPVVNQGWGAADIALAKQALLDTQTYLRSGVLDASASITVTAATITTGTIANAIVTAATIGDLNLTANASPTVGPEMDWNGNRGSWFAGVDVANAPTSRDFVMCGQRGTYVFNDGATTNGSAVVTSASAGGFSTALVGAAISGSGIPSGATVLSVASATSLTMTAPATATATGVTVTLTRNTSTDLAYWKHRGALSPTLGIGVTPPDGTARLQVSGADTEPTMGAARFRVGPSQTAKALTVHDSTPTDQWWIDKDFFMSGPTGVQVQAEPSASGHALLIADNTKTTNVYAFDMPTGSGGVMRLRYNTGNVSIADFGTDGSFRHLSTKIGFFGGAVTTKPTITGSRGGNAALASLLTAGAALGLWTDSTTA